MAVGLKDVGRCVSPSARSRDGRRLAVAHAHFAAGGTGPLACGLVLKAAHCLGVCPCRPAWAGRGRTRSAVGRSGQAGGRAGGRGQATSIEAKGHPVRALAACNKQDPWLGFGASRRPGQSASKRNAAPPREWQSRNQATYVRDAGLPLSPITNAAHRAT